MTAEIAVMNKEAVALAADSAVTFRQERGQKVLTSANKIFALSKHEPVGVMVYGSAEFMGLPWETVIKIYRTVLGKSRFGALRQYADDFLQFLARRPPAMQETYVRRNVYGYFALIQASIREEVEAALGREKLVDDQEVARITKAMIEKHHDLWANSELPTEIPKSHANQLRQLYGTIIDAAIAEVFEQLPLNQHLTRQLRQIAVDLFLKFPRTVISATVSGLVVAGFGEEDEFPRLYSFSVEGVAGDRLKRKDEHDANITLQNAARIVPFAQSEMVATFMEGVEPTYEAAVEKDISEILDEYPEVILDSIPKLGRKDIDELKKRFKSVSAERFEKCKEKLRDYRHTNYVEPVMSVVAMLPKDEMAAMAEWLVNLTSFRMRVSLGAEETVAGPIDVAVISKGDGFIWIKRKHYFRADLNPQFFSTYYREVDGGKKGQAKQ